MTNHDDEPDDFAAHLRAQPLAPLPDCWRSEILAAAARHTPSHSARWRTVTGALTAWLWPHPFAYAGLSAVWLLVLTLRLFTPAPTPFISPRSTWSQDTGKADYQAVLTQELLAINAVFPDAAKRGEGRP